MNSKKLAKKIAQAQATHKRKYLKYARQCEADAIEARNAKDAAPDAGNWSFKRAENYRAMAGKLSEVFSVPYRVRANRFYNAKHTLDFDALSGLGHSYRWYEIAKVIDGVQVLNTYRYSVTTSKHVREMRKLFKQLGIDFIEIEAPKGLQNLEAAGRHTLAVYGDAVVTAKHALKGDGSRYGSYYGRDLRSCKTKLRNLKRIGAKISKRDLSKALADAEDRRSERLEGERKKRAIRSVEFVSAENVAPELPGLRVVVRDRYSANSLVNNDSRWTRSQKYPHAAKAIEMGVKRVIVSIQNESEGAA